MLLILGLPDYLGMTVLAWPPVLMPLITPGEINCRLGLWLLCRAMIEVATHWIDTGILLIQLLDLYPGGQIILIVPSEGEKDIVVGSECL